MAEYTKENRRLVDGFLEHPKFKALAEADLGTPIKVVVWWDQNVVRFAGPNGAKVLSIDDILEGALALEQVNAAEAEAKEIVPN